VTLTCLIVDYGGVLTTPISSTMQSWADSEGLSAESIGEVVRAWVRRSHEGHVGDDPIRGLETGMLDPVAFEELLAADLRSTHGVAVRAEGLLSRMFAGFAHEELVNAAVVHARAAGIRTGLLSNSWGNTYDRGMWDLQFDEVVISGEVGLRKPDPAIYELTCERLGVSAPQCVFVDDLRPNVTAAVGLGMVGVHHTDPEQTVAELEVLFARPLRAGQETAATHG
jgi:epoxide hydrolase-like predicted phosphatase